MNKIEKSIYQGYLWYSNNPVPEVLRNREKEMDLDDYSNPFIIEALLCDGEKSYSIKYVDGKYITKIYDLSKLSAAEKTVNHFLPNQLNKSEEEDKSLFEIEKLIFYQYWHLEKDENCNNMEVLKPEELVFVGFNKPMKK